MATWPEPRPGLVVRYNYLWRREALAGREEGTKDRPCALVVAVDDAQDRRRAYVLPITHSRPAMDGDAIEVPATTKARLGLDSHRSWIVVTEANVFEWPGPDLRGARAGASGSAVYGMLPPSLFRAVRDRFVARARERKIGFVPRSDAGKRDA